jgi:hypothetical protein
MSLSALFGGGPNPPGTIEDRKRAVIQALIRLSPPEVVENWGHSAYADWWWSQQPEPVRRLREMTNALERRDEAIRLAAAGYIIDPAIAVWGMDAYRVQKLRADYGYTWVPAVGGDPILVAPGRSVPGLPSYDPHNPPPKSVLVDLEPEKHARPEKYLEKFDLMYLLSVLAVNYGVHM